MKHHVKGSTALLLASMWAGVAACDAAAELDRKASAEAQGAANVVVENEATFEAEAKADGAAAANGGLEVAIEPASFELEAVAGIVKQGELESAAELEVIVNDEARGYNHIDIDADGKIDHVQVVEVDMEAEVDADAEVDAEAEIDADVVLELRAIPSSKASVEAAVTFATVTFVRHPVNSEVEISASYTAVVRQPEVHVYTHVVPVKIDAGVFVGGSVFLSWVYATERPVYVGVYVVDDHGHWIPPGHVKHGHWKATGDLGAHGEVRGNAEGSGHGKASSHGKADGRFGVEIRGSSKGSGKIDLGGSSKSHKAHGGGHAGGGSGKGGSSSKSKGGKGKGK